VFFIFDKITLELLAHKQWNTEVNQNEDSLVICVLDDGFSTERSIQ